MVNSVVCEDGATAEWNVDSWGLVNIISNGAKKIKCNIDFKEPTLIEYLKNLESSELVEDDYGNLRYIGADPNNYVLFNNELWRIIGVMKDVENADGTKEDKVKLIRGNSIGSYSWDNKGDYGSSNWSTSALQKVLNSGAYWNRTSGNCPSSKYGTTKTCDFSESGLTEESKNMISESVWNLGSSSSSKITSELYTLERGEKVYSTNPTKWTGKVGLMYPSDYGYATAGGATTDRNTCLNAPLANWNESGVSDCKDNDWLLRSSQWTLASSSNNIFVVEILGNVIDRWAYASYTLHPSIYLNPSIEIDNGVGSSTSPFVLK